METLDQRADKAKKELEQLKQQLAAAEIELDILQQENRIEQLGKWYHVVNHKYYLTSSYIELLDQFAGDNKKAREAAKLRLKPFAKQNKCGITSKMCAICMCNLTNSPDEQTSILDKLEQTKEQTKEELEKPIKLEQQVIIITTCNHFFHRSCLLKWFGGKKNKNLMMEWKQKRIKKYENIYEQINVHQTILHEMLQYTREGHTKCPNCRCNFS